MACSVVTQGLHAADPTGQSISEPGPASGSDMGPLSSEVCHGFSQEALSPVQLSDQFMHR